MPPHALVHRRRACSQSIALPAAPRREDDAVAYVPCAYLPLPTWPRAYLASCITAPRMSSDEHDLSSQDATQPTVLVAGDRACLIRFAQRISPETNARVLASLAAIEAARFAWLVDLVPAYASLLVVYDPLQIAAADVRRKLQQALRTPTALASRDLPSDAGRLVEIPVWYDPAVAPDLEQLAEEKGLTPEALAGLHAAPEYRVYALGFRPGFPFLFPSSGVIDDRLAVPRLPAPRPRVAAGSVGIGGRQTGIYPTDGPGGWRIIGQTPLAIFDVTRPQPFLLAVGDRVRFIPTARPHASTVPRP